MNAATEKAIHAIHGRTLADKLTWAAESLYLYIHRYGQLPVGIVQIRKSADGRYIALR